ncbi:protein NYNRIN-like [Pyxicephalus adspersus]|uniref:protein NYNRIN-like n=1 Tax=Pyxicephalus adspersus TaxID=30357 RepID=UPI003B5969A4
MVIDTGAAISILHEEQPIFSPLSSGKPLHLQSFAGHNVECALSKPLDIRIGQLAVKQQLALMPLPNRTSLLGSDFLNPNGCIIDMSNLLLLQGLPTDQSNPVVIPDSHSIAAIKLNDTKYDLSVITKDHAEQELLRPILAKHQDAFAKHKHDCGRVDKLIHVTGPYPPPQKQYSFPQEAISYLKDTIDSLLDQGVIRVCMSTNNAPIWPIRKGDNSWRLTIDYRKLNKVTPSCAPTVASVPDVLSMLNPEHKYFTVLDISNGFWSLPLSEECQYKFAFTFLGIQYTFVCLPQGFHNSPSLFHATMRDIVANFSAPKNLFQYVDDLLLATSNKEDHLRLLDELLEVLKKAGLKCNPTKAQLLQESVSFLGITVTSKGRTISKEKVKAILNLPLPVSIPTLRSFLGLVNYSRAFIPEFAQTSSPLYDLLKKDTQWIWTEQHTNAVQALKEALAQAPALANPNYQWPFHIETATSETALSAVLSQEIHGQLRPISYASKLLSTVEMKYSLCEKHLLATFWAVKHFTYVIGLNPIILHTTHTPTKFLLTDRVKDGQVSNARLAHWALLLQDRDITVKHTPNPSTQAHGLIYMGVAHECDISPKTDLHQFFRPLPKESQSPERAIQIFTDGSCFYEEGSPHAGFGVYVVDPQNNSTSIARACQIKSAQYAEMAAIAHALEVTPEDQEIVLYSDSAWVCNALTEFLPFWHTHQYITSDGSPLKHARLLKYIVKLVQKRQIRPWVCKVRSHAPHSPYHEQNEKADHLAKHGAQGGEIWIIPELTDLQDPDMCSNVCALTKSTVQVPDISELQKQDDKIKEIIDYLKKESFEISEENILRKHLKSLILSEDQKILFHNGEELTWVVPETYRDQMIYLVHDLPTGGHQGAEKTYERLRSIGWWPNMLSDVQQYCENCIICAQVNAPLRKVNAPMRIRLKEGPWKTLQIDYMGPLPVTSKNNRYVLVVTDMFSKWVEMFPAKCNTAQVTARILIEQVFSRWGLPSTIESDQGSHFTGKVMQNCLQMLGVEQKFHIPYHPESSGQVERANRQIKTMLKKFVNINGKNWDNLLPLLAMAIRATPSSATKLTPFEVISGRQMRPEHLWIELHTPTIDRLSMDQYLLKLAQALREIHLFAAIHLGKSQIRAKAYFDRGVRDCVWTVGDKVMLLDFRPQDNNLSRKWRGPFTIIDKLSPSVMKISLGLIILIALLQVGHGEHKEPNIRVTIEENPVYGVEGQSVVLPVAVIGTDGGSVSWWGPADKDKAWNQGTQGNSTNYGQRVHAFPNGSLIIREVRLADAGEWIYAFLIPMYQFDAVKQRLIHCMYREKYHCTCPQNLALLGL